MTDKSTRVEFDFAAATPTPRPDVINGYADVVGCAYCKWYDDGECEHPHGDIAGCVEERMYGACGMAAHHFARRAGSPAIAALAKKVTEQIRAQNAAINRNKTTTPITPASPAPETGPACSDCRHAGPLKSCHHPEAEHLFQGAVRADVAACGPTAKWRDALAPGEALPLHAIEVEGNGEEIIARRVPPAIPPGRGLVARRGASQWLVRGRALARAVKRETRAEWRPWLLAGVLAAVAATLALTAGPHP